MSGMWRGGGWGFVVASNPRVFVGPISNPATQHIHQRKTRHNQKAHFQKQLDERSGREKAKGKTYDGGDSSDDDRI